MPVQSVFNSASFKTLLADTGEKLVIADFFGTWCAPCATIAPQFDRLSDDYKGSATFVRVDVEENPDLVDEWKIVSLPTFVFFRTGHEVDRLTGADPEELSTKVRRWIGPVPSGQEDSTSAAAANFLKSLVGLSLKDNSALSAGAFVGKGNRLGSAAEEADAKKNETEVKKDSDSSDSAGWLTSLKNLLPYSGGQGAKSEAERALEMAQEKLGLKTDLPMTAVQVRLEDNSKLKVKLNLTHSVEKIREFIVATRPEYKGKEFVFLAPQPMGGPSQIQDESVSIKDAKLENSMVTLKVVKK